jgi:hypothetical protein
MKNKREKELEQKGFESEIGKNLRNQELNKEYEDKLNSDYHPLAIAGVNFFGNLVIGYIFYFITKWFVRLFIGGLLGGFGQALFTILEIFIWGMAAIGVITKKSPWSRFLK